MAEVKPHLEEVRLRKEVETISKLPTHPNIAYYEDCYTFSTFAGEYDFGVLQYYEHHVLIDFDYSNIKTNTFHTLNPPTRTRSLKKLGIYIPDYYFCSEFQINNNPSLFMKLKLIFVVVFISLVALSCHNVKVKPENKFAKADSIKTDTVDSINNATKNERLNEQEEQKTAIKYNFSSYPKAKFKIFYGQSYGYDSEEHRFGYVIMIIDSVVFTRFHSPNNESWNALKFEKSYILTASQVEKLKKTLEKCRLRNKKPKEEQSGATGTATYRLIIDSKSLKVDGMVEWGTITGDSSQSKADLEKQIKEEKNASSSIGGNYELFISEMDKLFPELNNLKNKMEK